MKILSKLTNNANQDNISSLIQLVCNFFNKTYNTL